MALRTVVQYDGFDKEILRKNSKLVRTFDENLWDLLDDMWDTMDDNDGVGLAAVQVGVLKKVIICEINNMSLELVNPEIIAEEGSQIEVEGCLSVQKIRGKVERPLKVTVKAQDRMGNEIIITAEKDLAVCLCHEIDHTNGVIFTDKMIVEKED
jgi:peptide deformylase